MIAPWLVYSCAIGLIIVAIALLLEVIARWRPFPARWIWFMAILAIVTVPVALNFAMRTARHPEHGAPGQWIAMGAVPGAVTPAHHISLDTPLLAIWGVASLLMFTRVLAGAALLGHRRRSWESVELDGRSVLLTDDLGPAVVGWGRLDTVVPRWALALDPPSREMMLAHESEHARSGDPYLRTAAIAALVLMPWNPAIWYAMRRLRLAVEIDCDQRLLAGGIDAHRYASLLLAIGERMAAPPFAWVTALAGPRSSLESRILAMTSPFRPRNPRMVAAALTAGIALLVVVACEGPVPASVLPPAEEARYARGPEARSRMHSNSDTLMVLCSGRMPCDAYFGPDTLIVIRGRRNSGTVVQRMVRGKIVTTSDSNGSLHAAYANVGDNVADTTLIYRYTRFPEKAGVPSEIAARHARGEMGSDSTDCPGSMSPVMSYDWATLLKAQQRLGYWRRGC